MSKDVERDTINTHSERRNLYKALSGLEDKRVLSTWRQRRELQEFPVVANETSRSKLAELASGW
jgi:hypothetical protein